MRWMGVFDSHLIAPFLSAAKPAALRIALRPIDGGQTFVPGRDIDTIGYPMSTPEDLDEILELADRVAVMSSGHITYVAPVADTDRTTIGRHMAGH